LNGAPVNPADAAKYLPPVDLAKTPTTRALPEHNLLIQWSKLFLLTREHLTVTLRGYIKAGTNLIQTSWQGWRL